MSQSGKAVIENNRIVIVLDIDALQYAIDGAYGLKSISERQKVINFKIYAQELVNLLNSEDEQGTTQIHKLMDWAFNESLEQRCEGVERHPQQEF